MRYQKAPYDQWEAQRKDKVLIHFTAAADGWAHIKNMTYKSRKDQEASMSVSSFGTPSF